MPSRLWKIDRSRLNFQQKHLLSFIWWCAPTGCKLWNFQLAHKFQVAPRTIQRWLKILRTEKLIFIGFPDGKGRTIWPNMKEK